MDLGDVLTSDSSIDDVITICGESGNRWDSDEYDSHMLSYWDAEKDFSMYVWYTYNSI